MARDAEPMTDEELEAAREGVADAFEEVREDLSPALDKEPVPDGGEE